MLKRDSYISPSLLMDGIVATIGDELDDEHLRNVLYDMPIFYGGMKKNKNWIKKIL